MDVQPQQPLDQEPLIYRYPLTIFIVAIVLVGLIIFLILLFTNNIPQLPSPLNTITTTSTSTISINQPPITSTSTTSSTTSSTISIISQSPINTYSDYYYNIILTNSTYTLTQTELSNVITDMILNKPIDPGPTILQINSLYNTNFPGEGSITTYNQYLSNSYQGQVSLSPFEIMSIIYDIYFNPLHALKPISLGSIEENGSITFSLNDIIGTFTPAPGQTVAPIFLN